MRISWHSCKSVFSIVFFTIALFCVASYLHAGILFPELSGRVVDNADMISINAENRLKEALKQEEARSSNQIVVVTLPNLQGYTIEEFAYQLGREWKIGQKDKNNGVLFLIAKNERKIRIDVGYGLEGALTDALASTIIRNDIQPWFKSAQFDTGIEVGVESIIAAISGEYIADKKNEETFDIIIPLLFFILFIVITLREGGRGSDDDDHRSGGGFGHGRGSSGGGFSGGGFSGGGGSFGGGGASGGW